MDGLIHVYSGFTYRRSWQGGLSGKGMSALVPSQEKPWAA